MPPSPVIGGEVAEFTLSGNPDRVIMVVPKLSGARARRIANEAAAEARRLMPKLTGYAASRLFPPMTIHLISSGESSGELQAMLERAATNQERELEGLLAALVGLLGPLLIVGMGMIVMGIVFAMLLPIFELNQLIH